jgi:glycerol-3-phosphate O-acyltransferase/dihydroxyacetone phosphate acyltransferase
MAEAKVLHRVIRKLAHWAVLSFFTDVHIVGGENVPKDGPIIVVATHHNMMLDPAVLSSSFPYQRIMHYWSKASLFANPVMKYILESTGNIPVDRKSKDRQILFRGTFEALAKGNAVALFPEGTSYTEPRIMQVKDGASWSALEYMKWKEVHPKAEDVYMVPAAIVYTNKSKYRSDVIVEFGKPISVASYMEQFHADGRAAAKSLTSAVRASLTEMTINAPDWDTLYTARMARDLLWEANRSINLDEFVDISQTLVDVFSNAEPTSNTPAVRRRLLDYYALLQSTGLSNSVLSSLPLPRDLHPEQPASLPGRLYTAMTLIRDSLSSLSRLPFFIFPLIVHMPIYIMGRMGARLVEDEEETQAQNKVIFGLLLLLLIYPASFFFLWAFFLYTPMGAILAATCVYLFAAYHIKMINDNYEHAKRFVATWRVLLGVWAPKRLEMSLTALSQYTQPPIPKDNPYVERTRSVTLTPGATVVLPEPKLSKSEPPVKQQRKRKPSSRKIMRHVLRARAEAIKALASFFDQLERGENIKLESSDHLAKQYGWIQPLQSPGIATDGTSDVPAHKTDLLISTNLWISLRPWSTYSPMPSPLQTRLRLGAVSWTTMPCCNQLG